MAPWAGSPPQRRAGEPPKTGPSPVVKSPSDDAGAPQTRSSVTKGSGRRIGRNWNLITEVNRVAVRPQIEILTLKPQTLNPKPLRPFKGDPFSTTLKETLNPKRNPKP